MGIEILKTLNFSSYDPYDPWLSYLGVNIKRRYYQGDFSGKIFAIIIGLMDWLIPELTRYIFRSQPRKYPIVLSQNILRCSYLNVINNDNALKMLQNINSVSTDPTGNNNWSWGLGFPWMSKNGLYKSDVPFITHTPYAMEALLCLEKIKATKEQANNQFLNTWKFLQSLIVMYEDDHQLALSYAPIDEPRMVVNANSYAALAYALHSVYGKKEIVSQANERIYKIVHWIIAQQQENGSWFYYADNEVGNFIDCFHSCFVIKNLIKVKKLLPELSESIDPVIELGWRYLQNNFYDKESGLCRRFVQRDIKDPFRWDLYDQAEYLGLLVDFGLLDEAKEFADHIETIFKKEDNWYCRIDIFGRRWGKNFMRWGIVPFLYHQSRLNHQLARKNISCVE